MPSFDAQEGTYPSFLTNRDGELLAPYPHDELSGLPLCYTPHFDLPAPSTKPISGNRIADWEHLVPRAEVVRSVDNPMLATEMGKAALVNARIQWVSFDEHHAKKITPFAAQPIPRHSRQ